MAESNDQLVAEDQRMQEAKEVLQATYVKFHMKNDQAKITATLIKRLYNDTLKAFNSNAITINECQRNIYEILTAQTKQGPYLGKESQRLNAQDAIEDIQKEIFPERDRPFQAVNVVNVNYVMMTHGVNNHTKAEEVASILTILKVAAENKELATDVVQAHVDSISSVHLDDEFANVIREKVLFGHAAKFEKLGVTVNVQPPKTLQNNYALN